MVWHPSQLQLQHQPDGMNMEYGIGGILILILIILLIIFLAKRV